MLSLKNPRLWRYIIICVLSDLLACLLWSKDFSTSFRAVQIIGIAVALFIGIVTFVLALRILFTIVLWLTLRRFKGLFLPQKFTFNRQGMRIENAFGGSVTRDWGGFVGWKKLKNGYLLRLFPAGVISFKRSDIPEDKVMAFEELLTSNITKS